MNKLRRLINVFDLSFQEEMFSLKFKDNQIEDEFREYVYGEVKYFA